MEVDEIQQQPPTKLSRIGNGERTDSTKLAQKGTSLNEEGCELIKRPNLGNGNRLIGWHHSSRIIRVSRASGGKDRHSKVWTSKGLRDRRVRLSVTTAIQFYDLQDRLGYDQPSKAVEWLIKAASDAINELPSLDGSSFSDTPKQFNGERRSSEHGFDSADRLELEEDTNFNQNQNKSACSSTSDTSKGSGLSKSDIRVDREKENHHQQNMNRKSISQNSTFTELLTGGISSTPSDNNGCKAAAVSSPGSEVDLFHHKVAAAAAARQWPFMPMDYFGGTTHQSSGFSGQIQLRNSISQPMTTMSFPSFNFSGEHHHHVPYVSDHLFPVATAQSPDSSGHIGFNRGTLQSNLSSSQSLLIPHFQRLSSSSPIDGSTNIPFFIGAAAAQPPPLPMENHHYHHFPPGLHLYGDGSKHSDHRNKGKN